MAETTIWKFALPLPALSELVSFTMPRGAVVRSAVNQREHLCVYAEVDPGAKPVKHTFRVAGTGHPLGFGSDLEVKANGPRFGSVHYEPYPPFVGTVVFAGGDLVFHVYDLGE